MKSIPIPVPTDMKPGEERTFYPPDDHFCKNPPLVLQMFEHNLDEGWIIWWTSQYEVMVEQPLGTASKFSAAVTIRYVGCFLEDYAIPDGDPRLIERAERMVYDYRADRIAAIRAARQEAGL